MKRVPLPLASATAALAALVLIACGRGPMEPNSMNADLRETRPVCVGHHIVDLPRAFELAGNELLLYFMEDEGASHRTISVLLEPDRSDDVRFTARVDKRAAEIGKAYNFATNGSMLVAVDRDTEREIMLTRYASPDTGTAVDLEFHTLIEDRHLALRGRSFDGQTEMVEKALRRVAEGVKPAAPGESPGDGFCMGPLMVGGDGDYEIGELKFRVRQGPHEDLRFELSTNSFPDGPESDRLLGRTARGLAHFGILGTKSLRRGDSQLAGHPAEEVLLRFRSNGHHAHGFAIEAYPSARSTRSPGMRLELNSGRIMDDDRDRSASLTDDQAIAMWDAIIDSFRPK